MNERVAISVRNVSKAYRIWKEPNARLTSPALKTLAHLFPSGSRPYASLTGRAESYYRDFYALQGISFEVRRGESVGIIGRNGSGKSTLLQIIAGTLTPTTGSVQVNGRVSALLELGSGFNPEFTGRENVFINGAVLGLSRQEIESRFDAIAAFADIGDYIDQPVKTYSSGMQVRLAFAVSINVDADIIIVDEALSVGDVNFQAKCITALRQLQSRGTTFLIVTHGVDVVKSMCQRGVYLKQGCLASCGPAPEVADHYFREMREQLSAEIARSQLPSHLSTQNVMDLEQQQGNTSERPVFSDSVHFRTRMAAQRSGTGEAEITDVELLDESGQVVRAVDFNQSVRLRIHLRLNQDLEFNCGYHIRDEFNLTLLSSGSFTETNTVLRGRAGDRVILELSTLLPLRHGRYSILALISTNYIMNKTAQFVDWVEDAVVFEVLPRTPQILWAPVYLKNEIRVWQLPT